MKSFPNLKQFILRSLDLDYTYPSTRKTVQTYQTKNNYNTTSYYKGTIDIVMPTFNRQRETRRCIENLYKTCKTSFRLIVVDNNSTDGTKDLLLNLQKSNDNMNVISLDQNLGGSGARNEGLKLAKNEFVAFLDNDIYIMPNYFEHLINSLQAHPDIIAVQSKVVLPNGLIQINRPHFDIQNQWIVFKDKDFEKSFNDSSTLSDEECNWIPSGATLWRREIFYEHKFDLSLGTYYEDNEFSFRLNKLGYKFMNNHKALCLHYSSNFAPDLSKGKYSEERWNNDSIRNALKIFYNKHDFYLAFGDIEGHVKYLGFSSKEEYIEFLKS